MRKMSLWYWKMMLVAFLTVVVFLHLPSLSALVVPGVGKTTKTMTTTTSTAAPLPPPPMTMRTDCGISRRQMGAAVSSIFLAAMVGGATFKPSVAADGDPPASVDKSVLLGTYTDPINHPGGTRTIEFQESPFSNFLGGAYQLATVKGGGGRGEPELFELPAMIFECPGNKQVLTRASNSGKLCITIDFTPKGGPKDFTGYYDDSDASNPGIRFIVDNNFWPKVK